MTAILKWNAPSAWTNAFEAADLNSLGIATTVISTSNTSGGITNGTGLDLLMDVSIQLGSMTPVAPNYLGLFLLPLLADGTTYADGDSATATAANMATASFLGGTAVLRLKAASAQNVMIGSITIPPGTFKLYLYNGSGVAFPASGNTAKYRTYSLNTNG